MNQHCKNHKSYRANSLESYLCETEITSIYGVLSIGVCNGIIADRLIFLFNEAPPRIELNPNRQTVGPGESPAIICTATGDQPLTIEWEAIGRPLPYSVSNNRGVLQFHGITYADAGKYVCKAMNDAGTAEAVAEVLVSGKLCTLASF